MRKSERLDISLAFLSFSSGPCDLLDILGSA